MNGHVTRARKFLNFGGTRNDTEGPGFYIGSDFLTMVLQYFTLFYMVLLCFVCFMAVILQKTTRGYLWSPLFHNEDANPSRVCVWVEVNDRGAAAPFQEENQICWVTLHVLHSWYPPNYIQMNHCLCDTMTYYDCLVPIVGWYCLVPPMMPEPCSACGLRSGWTELHREAGPTDGGPGCLPTQCLSAMAWPGSCGCPPRRGNIWFQEETSGRLLFPLQNGDKITCIPRVCHLILE